MKISEEMLNVKKELLDIFVEYRNKINNNSTNEELFVDENFKKCYLINFLLSTIFDDENAYDAAELILSNNNFETNTLLDSYSVKYDDLTKNFKIEILND